VGEVEGDLHLHARGLQEGAELLYAQRQAVLGHPVVVQVAPAEVALHARGEGSGEIRLQHHDDGPSAGQDILRIGAGGEVESHPVDPSVLLAQFLEDLALFLEGLGRGETDVNESEFVRLFDDCFFADHGPAPFV
jgi:hypothetical protein